MANTTNPGGGFQEDPATTTSTTDATTTTTSDGNFVSPTEGGLVPSGDGGGKPKPPPDPYAPIMRSFFSAYFKIWGTLPPPGYVESAARSMNLYEFIDQERKKPAYRHTKAYKNEAAKYAALRDQLLGYY